MTVVIGGNFHSSEVKKLVNPYPDICQKIEDIERILVKLEVFDEVKEQVGSPFSQIVYKKDAQDFAVIAFNKNKYYLKLTGYNWDIAPFLSFPVKLEFAIEKSLSWKLENIETINNLDLEKVLMHAFKPSKDLQQLMTFILSAISAYVSKASFIHESATKIKAQVLEYFWKGEISAISDLYAKSSKSNSDHFHQFLKKWQEKLPYSHLVDAEHVTEAMDIDRLSLENLLKTIQVYVNQAMKNYIHSIKNLWFNMEMLQDETEFLLMVKEYRTWILLTEEFLKDMDFLVEEALSKLSQETGETSKSEATEDILSTVLLKTPNADGSIPFFSKYDLFTENPNLVISEEALCSVVSYLANGSKNSKEYSHLLRIIFNRSLQKGFTVRDIIKTFFIDKYDTEAERKDFEQRYDVKRLFVKSTLEYVFENLMERLIELNIIKVERTIIQSKEQEKITFNYNVKIFDKS